MAARTYRIRTYTNTQGPKPTKNYSLTLPNHISDALIKQFGSDITFECELTEDGIVYRPAEEVEEAEVPASWADKKLAKAKPRANSKPATKPAASRAKAGAKASTAKKTAAKRATPASKAKTAAKPAAKRAAAKPATKPTRTPAKTAAKKPATRTRTRKPAAA